MIEEPVAIRTGDGTSRGFIYHADDGRPRPGVLHLTDIWGVRPSHRAKARRLAEEGYTVLLPNVLYRTGEAPFLPTGKPITEEETRKVIASLSGPLTPDAMERDLAAYVDFLTGQPSVARGPIGVVGHCLTGAMALRAAAAFPDRVAAIASFHGGGLYKDGPTSPHLVLPRVRARLYFGHADRDRSMPAEAIEKFEEALAAWGGRFESETYAGAGHGWTVSDRPVYDPAQAERAWGKLTALFRETLG
jgi:carboxymethylenebutenolidase